MRRPSPLMPWEPSKNLHVIAGGSPLRSFSASNIQGRSKPPREACDSPENMASLIKDVGFIKPLTHTAGFAPLCHSAGKQAFRPPVCSYYTPEPKKSKGNLNAKFIFARNKRLLLLVEQNGCEKLIDFFKFLRIVDGA